MTTDSFQVAIGCDFIAGHAASEILRNVSRTQMAPEGQLLLLQGLHGLRSAIQGIYAETEGLSTLGANKGMILFVNNHGCAASTIDLKGILEDGEIFSTEDPFDGENAGMFWHVLMTMFTEEGKTASLPIMQAITRRLGREAIERWHECISKGAETGAVPVLCAVAASRSHPDDTMEVSGIMTMVAMPLELPEIEVSAVAVVDLDDMEDEEAEGPSIH